MTSFNEFIESKELEEIVGSDKYPKYKYKFSKVIKKAGVGDLDISDEVAISKLGMGSWNWYAFLFNFAWSLYLNITSGKNNHWYGLAILIAFYLFLDVIGTNLSSALPMIIAVIFGMMGNGFFLQEIVRKYNSGHRGVIPKSTLNIFIVYGVLFLYGGLSAYLFFDQL